MQQEFPEETDSKVKAEVEANTKVKGEVKVEDSGRVPKSVGKIRAIKRAYSTFSELSN
jgi:hypothetical protein